MSQCDNPHEHEFFDIAPEAGDEDGLMWEWCIRCGRLKLGGEIFTPGPTQSPTIVADE